MGMAMNADGITTPPYVSQNLADYSASCEKFNQSIMILWRQKLPGDIMPPIPQDHGLPVCTVYGAYATLKMRGFHALGMGVNEIVHSSYGEGMAVEPTQSRNWSYNAVMRRGDEVPVRAEEVAVQISTMENPPVVPGFNEALRESSEIVANVDKGFRQYIKYFRDELPVTAAVRVEKGHHGDCGWGVYFEQRRRRCVLAGTVVDRPEEEAWEDTMWTACAEWANFEPVLGRQKYHRETLLAPDQFGHIFAGDTFEAEYAAASEYRRAAMDKFALGTRKFAQAYEFRSAAEEDPPNPADGYAYHAPASRRVRISDGPSLWEEGQVVFVSPSSQSVAGTSPQVVDISSLRGRRVQDGPGEGGTG
jgi:hypothetical protein